MEEENEVTKAVREAVIKAVEKGRNKYSYLYTKAQELFEFLYEMGSQSGANNEIHKMV